MLNLQSLLNTEKIINISIVFENIKENQVFSQFFFGHERQKKNEDLGSYPKGQFFRRIWHSPHGLCLFPLFKRISAVFLAFLPLPKSVLLQLEY